MKKKTKAKTSFENSIKEIEEEQNKLDFDLISTIRENAKEKAENLIKKINENNDILKNEQLSIKNKKKLKTLYEEIQDILKIDDTNEILNYWSFKLMGILKMKINDEIKFYQIMLNRDHQIDIMNNYKMFNKILDYKTKLIDFLKNLFSKNKDEIIEAIKKEIENEKTLFCPKLNFSFENENLYYYIIYRDFLIFLNEEKISKMKYFIQSCFDYIKDKNSEYFTREKINYILLIINNFDEKNFLPNLKSFTFIDEKEENKIIALNRYLNINKMITEKKTINNNIILNYDNKTLTLNKNELCFTKLFHNCYIDFDYLNNEEYKIECKMFKYFVESNIYYKNIKEKKELLDFLKTFFSSSIVEEMYYKYRDKDNKYIFLFKKYNAVKELFDNFFIFPFNSLSGSKSYGFTNKYTLDVFISGYININYSFNTNLKFDYYILFFGSFFITSIHECCGHYLFSYYYYISTEIKYLLTPKLSEDSDDPLNKELCNIDKENKTFEFYDRGDKVEVILFGEKIKKLYFSGALFLLDQIYTNKIKLDEFKENFKFYNKEKGFYKIDKNTNKNSFLKKLIHRKNIKIEEVNELQNKKNTNIPMNRSIKPRNIEYDQIEIDGVIYNYISKSDSYIEFQERVRKDVICDYEAKRISWENYNNL